MDSKRLFFMTKKSSINKFQILPLCDLDSDLFKAHSNYYSRRSYTQMLHYLIYKAALLIMCHNDSEQSQKLQVKATAGF